MISSTINPAGPTAPEDRWQGMDALRALALLGILMVNVGDFRAPEFYRKLADIPMWEGTWTMDIAASALVQWLVAGKCITIFTMAFGFGLQRILDRMTAAGVSPWLPGLRRLGFLFLLGLLHVLLVWFGDILMFYALVGVVVLLMHRLPAVAKLVVAALMMGLTLLVFLGFWALGLLMEDTGDEAIISMMGRSLEVYATGSWGEIFVQRMNDLVWTWLLLFLWMPMTVALMLAGAWAAQTGWLEQDRSGLEQHLRFWMWAGLGLGLPLNAWSMVREVGFVESSALADLVWTVTSLVGPPLLALGYIAAVLQLARASACRGVVAFLAPTGRMSLTLYLMQSVVATLIFYSFGLGLYGQVGALHGLLLGIGIFVCQVGAARWWLARRRYGPLEAAWRWATYG